MKKNVLEEVYDYLKEIEAVESESEFSVDWLGRSESYMRGLRFKRAQPSIGTLAICANKLFYYGGKFKNDEHKGDIVLALIQLGESCNRQVNSYLSNSW